MATREGKDPAGHGYAFSMAKRDATATKTAQLKCVNLLDFRGFVGFSCTAAAPELPS